MRKTLFSVMVVVCLMAILSAVAFAEVVYQENANATACEGSGDSPACSFGLDGDWDTFSSGAYQYNYQTFMNYTKPAGATNGSWQMKYNIGSGVVLENWTIPTECFGDETQPQVELKIVNAFDGFYVQCLNYAQPDWWSPIVWFSGENYAPKSLFEEALWWEVVEPPCSPNCYENYSINTTNVIAYDTFTRTGAVVGNLEYPPTNDFWYEEGGNEFSTDGSEVVFEGMDEYGKIVYWGNDTHTSVVLNNIHTIEFDFKKNIDSGFQFRVGNSLGGNLYVAQPFFTFEFTDGYGGCWGEGGTSISTDTNWHHYKIVLDFTTNTTDMWRDNILTCENIPVPNGWITSEQTIAERIDFTSYYTSGGEYLLDNFILYNGTDSPYYQEQICVPDWVCVSYGDCVSGNFTCDEAEDLNVCGEQYAGNFSEFDTFTCPTAPFTATIFLNDTAEVGVPTDFWDYSGETAFYLTNRSFSGNKAIWEHPNASDLGMAVFPEDMTSLHYEAMIFDQMGMGYMEYFGGIYIEGSGKAIWLGEIGDPNYTLWLDWATEIDTNITRTYGWHKFEMDFEMTEFPYFDMVISIDENVVYTTNEDFNWLMGGSNNYYITSDSFENVENRPYYDNVLIYGVLPCNPIWVCSLYNGCVNNLNECLVVSDQHQCGEVFGGQLSDFDEVCSTEGCYQESSEVANQTGQDGNCGLVYDVGISCREYNGGFDEPEHICGGGIDGDWNTYADQNGQGYNVVSIEMDYTAPEGAIGVIWRTKAIDGQIRDYNLTEHLGGTNLKVSWWSTTDTGGYLEVWNDTEQQYNILFNGGSNLNPLYDEAMIWFFPPVCVPEWNCSLFDDCVGGTKECLAVEDLNECGEPFEGLLSDFDEECQETPTGYVAQYETGDLGELTIDTLSTALLELIGLTGLVAVVVIGVMGVNRLRKVVRK